MASFPALIIAADEHSSRLFVRRSLHSPLVELIDYADTADLREHHPAPSVLIRTDGRTRFKPRSQRSREELEIFLRHVATQIDHAMSAEQGVSLAIVAPPLVLGYLRDFIAAGTRSKLVHESYGDLVKSPIIKIDAAVRGMRL